MESYGERIPTSNILIYSSPVLDVFMARIWDAVTGPAARWWSDRTHRRLGRRRPRFLGSALPLVCSIVMLWSPPESLEGGYPAAWVGCSIILLFTAYTAFRVPHIAVGAELSRGYHERIRVFGIMQATESFGMFAASGNVTRGDAS